MTSATVPTAASVEAHTTTEVLDALPRLDHVAQRSAIALRDAAPGRYLLVEGKGEGWLIPIAEAVVHVGRGFAADLRLEDPGVSRRHAILVRRAGGTRVLDDRSANGTWVNGRRVESADLADGDVLVVGSFVLGYVEVR
jgi:pSer/pThr/pTyr-binding forkhead associated (FHA) protein